MIHDLLASLLKDILRFLSQNSQFFELPEEKRRTALKKLDLPGIFIQYLSLIPLETFLHDLKSLIKSCAQACETFQKHLNPRLTQAFTSYLLHDFLQLLENPPQQTQLLPTTSNFHQTLQEISNLYSYQEITNSLNTFLSQYHATPYIVVQVPHPIETNLRHQIRLHLQKKFPRGFPIFQVNNELIGGLRLFLDSTVRDHSWLSQINKITALS